MFRFAKNPPSGQAASHESRPSCHDSPAMIRTFLAGFAVGAALAVAAGTWLLPLNPAAWLAVMFGAVAALALLLFDTFRRR